MINFSPMSIELQNVSSEELIRIAESLLETKIADLEIKIFKVLQADIDGDGQAEICFSAGDPLILDGIVVLLDQDGDEYKAIEVSQGFGFRDLQILDINQDGILEILIWWLQGSYLFLDLKICQWNGSDVRSLFPSLGHGGCPFGAIEIKDLDADGVDEIIVWSGGWEGSVGVPRPFEIHTFKYNGQIYDYQTTHTTDFLYFPNSITNMAQGGSFNSHFHAHHRATSVQEYRAELESRIQDNKLNYEFLFQLVEHQSIIQREGFLRESIEIGDLVLKGTDSSSSPEMLRCRRDALGIKGFTLGLLGDYISAVDCYRQIIELWSSALSNEINNTFESLYSATYREMGFMYSALGDYEHALTCLSTAKGLAKKLPSSLLENHIEWCCLYSSFGEIYTRLNNPKMAVASFRRAIRVCKRAIQRFGDKYPRGNNPIYALIMSYIGLGNAQRSIHAYPDAIQSYRTALKELSVSPARNREADLYVELGLALVLSGQLEEGLTYLQRSLLFATEGNLRQMEAKHYLYIGEAYRRLGDFQIAQKFYEKMIRFAEEFGTPETQWQASYGLALVHQQQCRDEEYHKALVISIETIEKLRTQYLPQSLKISLLTEKTKPFEAMVLASVCHMPTQAFDYMERIKSRVFIEELATTTMIRQPELPPELLQKESQLVKKLRNLQLQHRQDSNQQVYQWDRDIEDLENQLEALWRDLSQQGQKGAEYVELRRASPVPFAGVNQILSNL